MKQHNIIAGGEPLIELPAFAFAERYPDSGVDEDQYRVMERKLMECKSDLTLIRAALYRNRNNPDATFLFSESSGTVMSRRGAKALARQYSRYIGRLEASLLRIYTQGSGGPGSLLGASPN